MADKELDRLLDEHGARKSFRTGEESAWTQIIEMSYPDGTPPWRSNDIFDSGSQRSQIYDNTAEDAADTASAALHAMTTNPATRWFELGMFDEQIARDTAAGSWLWRHTSKMLRCFRHPSARFNLAMDEDNAQLINLGNSCLHVEERMGKLPLYRACDMAHIWWDENADGEIDIVGREFSLTARAAVEKFGADVPEQVWKMAEGRGTAYDMVNFLHVNEPRNERDRTKRDRRNMAFRSTYLCLDFPAIVRVGGSHELEYVCSRLRKRAGRRYGRGCGHRALGDNDILQRMNRTVLLAGELTIQGPTLVPDDEDFGPVTFKPRGIMRVRPDLLANGAHPRPYLTNTRVDIGLDLINDRRELVRRSYLKQLIELARDPKFTATQFLSLEAEAKRGLAPLLGRMEVERLGPIVGRTYNVLKRIPGIMEPVPPELAGQPLQPNFDSPDAKAMRLGVARSIAQALEVMAPAVQATGDDAAWDNFDLDEGWRAQGEGMSMPSALLRPTDVRDRMREQRQAVTAERAQLEGFKDFTTGIKNAAPMAAVVAGMMKNGGADAAAAPAGAAA